MKGNDLGSGLEYVTGLVSLLLVTRYTPNAKIGSITLVGFVVTGFTLLVKSNSRYVSLRVQAFLHPEQYGHGESYQFVQGLPALKTAGLWGHGLHASLPFLPSIQSSMVFNYFVYSFGWISGISLVALMLGLVFRMVWIGRQTSDHRGAALVCGLGTALAVQFVYPVLMGLGIVPMLGVYMPMFGTSSAVSVVEMASLGLVLGVYRRRNISRRSRM
jgi:rod shape determining protein RodA